MLKLHQLNNHKHNNNNNNNQRKERREIDIYKYISERIIYDICGPYIFLKTNYPN